MTGSSFEQVSDSAPKQQVASRTDIIENSTLAITMGSKTKQKSISKAEAVNATGPGPALIGASFPNGGSDGIPDQSQSAGSADTAGRCYKSIVQSKKKGSAPVPAHTSAWATNSI